MLALTQLLSLYGAMPEDRKNKKLLDSLKDRTVFLLREMKSSGQALSASDIIYLMTALPKVGGTIDDLRLVAEDIPDAVS